MRESPVAGVYNIPAASSFLDVLAQGLLKETRHDPLQLSRYTLFLPTRQDCHELQRAFLRKSEGQPLLLPRMLPLGDLDQEEELILNTPLPDLPPVLPKFKRQGLLMKLILHYTQQHAGLVSPHSAASAAQLSQALMGLIDEGHVEGVNWEKLAELVPSHLAAHWQITLDFLHIVREHWPEILKATGHVEPQVYNGMATERLVQRWQENPPQHPVIAAGSTATRQTTFRLLEAIAQMPLGSVVLPGFDGAAKVESPSHPMHAHTQFLQRMKLNPLAVPEWGPVQRDGPGYARGKLFLGALAQEPQGVDNDLGRQALEGWSLIEANTPQEEALCIGLKVREVLSQPGKTVALVANNDSLFERVRAEMSRWGINGETGARSLKSTPQGKLLLLLLDVIHSQCDAHALLSLLKFPLVKSPQVGELETRVLRGPALQPGLEALRLACEKGELEGFVEQLMEALSPLEKLMAGEKVAVRDLVTALLQAVEKLVMDKDELWQGPEGESLALFIGDLMEAADDFPNIKGADFCELMDSLLDGYLCVGLAQMHPRLRFLKPHQARLHQSDVQILAGLNEASWPKEAAADSWMNQSMRQEMGLSTPEHKLGLTTHDFYQAFTAKEVVLTRALRDQGAPTVASRWLMRLEVSLEKSGVELPRLEVMNGLARQMDMPEAVLQPQRPNPCPPVAARPRQLSVTQVETWMRDPYALYARQILRLKPMDDIAMAPSASDRGVIFHRAFEDFLVYGGEQTYEELLAIGQRHFAPLQSHVDVSFFWWPRFKQVAKWFVTKHKELDCQACFTEIRGSLSFTTEAGELFTVIAQADRIDQRGEWNMFTLVDYKTGQPPAVRDVEQGLSPQMSLESAILMGGGFPGVDGVPEAIEFWWLKGGNDGGQIQKLRRDPQELADEALQGLRALVDSYDKPTTTYPAMPWATRALRYNDYAHLARIAEWRDAV